MKWVIGLNNCRYEYEMRATWRAVLLPSEGALEVDNKEGTAVGFRRDMTLRK